MINMPQNGPDFQVEDEKNTAKVIPLNSHSTGVAPTDEDLANAVKVAEQQITVSSAIDHSIWGLRRSLSRPVAKATTEEPKPWWEEVEETEGDEQPAQRQQPQTQPYAPQRAPTQSKPAVNQSGKYDDFAQKMIALSAERKREEVNDGWKQYESVPERQVIIALTNRHAATVDGVCWRKSPDGTYWYREDEDKPAQRQQPQTPPEAPESDEKQGNKADSSSDNLDKVRSYRKFETERYVNDRLFRDGFLELLSPAAVKLFLFIGSKCNDDGVCYHSHETMMQLTGLSRNTIKRAIAELVKNRLIEVKAVDGKPNHYRLL